MVQVTTTNIKKYLASMTALFSKNSKMFNIKDGLLCFFMLTVFSCNKSGNTVTPQKDTTASKPPGQVNFPKITYNPIGLDTTKLFNTVPVVNDLARTDLLEISGVAASRINPGTLYIHN